ncbi:chemotaxis protein CheA [Scytonema sp. UIC 10036]|uniref:chemotaxis protein CheW n=1 Tax=Scytonema sp. UIC 10036 TaxID=2304196 RepID=UPI0012DA1BC5|nr:chemotaxis protein CheW [Scytonema sp. UIC 10036]MUG95282.1 chemotaxis protein CheA [Scytonema sp. UIC 10036]
MELAENDDIEAFLLESYENLDRIERDIIDLETASSNGEALVRIYRSLHTLKGNCGFLPFPKLESLAHAGESLLSSLRDDALHSPDGDASRGSRPKGDRKLAVTPQIVSILLQTVDSIRQILYQIKTTKHEGDNDYSALIKALTQLQETEPAIAVSGLPLSDVNPPTPQQGEFVESSGGELAEVSVLTASESSHIRVNVSLLDRVMNLVGELVLVRNQVLGFSDRFQDTAFVAACQRLNLITAQLQEGVMKTRLQPMSTIWQKFPRVIRDLALTSGKQVQVEMEGADTELDKSIVEAIKDPLTHLVRNCIDHGIELPAERAACGKPTVGHIFLRAFYESGKVNIEIGDDGRGLDPEQLKVRSQQLGLVSAVQAATMSESEAMNLIFLPGFSTSEQVTTLSGRGVGMDIVKSNIEKINGSIEIHSQLGQGTTFKLKIPLTLTIIPALIVTCGGDRYALPQTSLQELVRLEAEQAVNSIEMLYDVPVYRLRGDLVPLVYLNQVLQIEDKVTSLETLSLVIVQAENYRFGLIVDTIEDILDIVVKPLGKQLQVLSLFAGATILGDGRVALIIDVVGLANRAGIITKQKQLLSSDTAANIQDQVNRQQILLFQSPQSTPMGIPLTVAFRLEEIPLSAVEKVGNHYVVQSYGRILPLIDLHAVFGDGEGAFVSEAETLEMVIVSPYPELSVGLVVDRILDIVEEPLTIEGIPSRPGVLMSAVIQGRITEILDIETVIRISNPYLLQTTNRG